MCETKGGEMSLENKIWYNIYIYIYTPKRKAKKTRNFHHNGNSVAMQKCFLLPEFTSQMKKTACVEMRKGKQIEDGLLYVSLVTRNKKAVSMSHFS